MAKPQSAAIYARISSDQDGRGRGVQRQLADCSKEAKELRTYYAEKKISMRDWLDAKKPIEARIEAAERRISRATHTDALTGLPGNGDRLRGEWDSLNLTR